MDSVNKCKMSVKVLIPSKYPNLYERFRKLSQISINAIAKEFKVSRHSFRRFVQEDLQYKSYGIWRGQLISAMTKDVTERAC